MVTSYILAIAMVMFLLRKSDIRYTGDIRAPRGLRIICFSAVGDPHGRLRSLRMTCKNENFTLYFKIERAVFVLTVFRKEKAIVRFYGAIAFSRGILLYPYYYFITV